LYLNGNEVLSEELSATQLCVGDDQLLKLLELIPALAPFKPVIDDIIKVHGFIPAEVFSVCLNVNNLDIEQHEAKGCPELDSQIMCFKGKCLFSGANKFPCFDLHY
jgi:hypothetical protein